MDPDVDWVEIPGGAGGAPPGGSAPPVCCGGVCPGGVLILLLGMDDYLDWNDRSLLDQCCRLEHLVDHWVDRLLLLPLAWCSAESTLLDMWLHWMLQGHVEPALEGVAVEVEVWVFPVDCLENSHILEGHAVEGAPPEYYQVGRVSH